MSRFISLRTHIVVASCAMLSISAGCGADDSEYGLAQNNSIGEQYYPAPEDPRTGETYDKVVENEFVEVAAEDTSTFSIDVDNASYTLMRRDITADQLPLPESVRPEEYINFFDYNYKEPMGDDPFSINLEVAPSTFGQDGEKKHLLRIGLQGKDIARADIAPTNLVFLIDVSGSMSSDEKLPMVKQSLYALIDNLRPEDTIGIVVYAGNSGTVLKPTPVKNAAAIRAAIDRLQSGGSTNGEAGIVGAYQLAEQAKIEGGNNRVLILTDGDFNVGKTGEPLIQLIESYREKHISLTCVGYGLGNYNDYHMENLSNKGNGNYFYVDSLDEANRIFGSELASTLEVIAADVKIQVEFDKTSVKSYRLVGYENRVLKNEDFEDDTKDAGEIGPGHSVTAYYELVLEPEADRSALLSTVRLRYKSRYGTESKLLERAIKVGSIAKDFNAASDSFKFGAAVAEYAEILRESKHSKDARFDDVLSIINGAMAMQGAKQVELISLVEKARSLWQSSK